MQNLMSLDSHGGLKNLALKDGNNQITKGRIKMIMMVFNPSLSRLSSSLNKKVPDWQARFMMFDCLMALESLKS